MPPSKRPPPRKSRVTGSSTPSTPVTSKSNLPTDEKASSGGPSTPPTLRLGSLGKRLTPGGPTISSSSVLSPTINTSGTPGSSSKRAFTPKQVNRRSKETRDKSAPAPSKITIPTVHPPGQGFRGDKSGRGGNRGGNRGRGRGGRGRGRFEPISTVAVGAFSSIGAYDGQRKAGPAFEIKGNASLGEDISSILPGTSKASSSGLEEDDEIYNDPNSFNMTRSLGVDIDNFFPIRPAREEEKIDGQDHEDKEEDVKIKPVDLGLQQRLLSATPFSAYSGDFYRSPEELTELKRVAKDHTTIAREFNISSILNTRASNTPGVASTPELSTENHEERPEIEQKLFFFQMPILGPKFEKAKVAEQDDEAETPLKGKSKRITHRSQQSEEQKEVSTSTYPEGMAGKLRLHKSGKLTMLLGNIVMEVSQGTEANFLQDVVAIHPEDQKAYLIGQVTRKMIVSPDIYQLLAGVGAL